MDIIGVAAHAREPDERALPAIHRCMAGFREIPNSGMGGSKLIAGITGSIDEADFGPAKLG
jgi:hypothetical protein